MTDRVLLVWIALASLWDFAVFGVTTYLVFWRDCSGWWFALAFLLCCQLTLLKVPAKKYGVPRDDD